MTEGFYNAELVWGPNFVVGPGFELWKELKDTYTYPVNGWTWFDSIEEAAAFYGITLPAGDAE